MPTFDNSLKSLFIDGKEVIRASLDGKVFYDNSYKLNLTASKSIIQAGETTVFTAGLTYRRAPVQGETVIFSSDSPIETTNVDSSGTYDFGERFVINCSNLPEIRYINHGIQIGQNPSVWISRDLNGYLNIMFTGGSVMSNVNDPIIIEDGVLKAYSFIYNRYLTRDVSDVDLTKWTLGEDISGTIIPVEHYFYESAVTDVNGECSVSYVGKGTGVLNIKSEAPERMISSEIYAVIDGIWYDNFSSDTLWRYMNGRVNTVYNDGIDVTITGISPYLRIRQNYLPLSQVMGKRIHFEYTVEKPSNKSIQATIYKEINGSYVATNSQYTTENTVSLEVDIGEEVTNIIFQMSLTNFSNGESLKIKEVKVYSI